MLFTSLGRSVLRKNVPSVLSATRLYAQFFPIRTSQLGSNSHLFITSWVCSEPNSLQAPSLLVSSVGRALHRYRRGHGFKSIKILGLIFTTA